MNIDQFRASVQQAQPPADCSRALQAMWWDEKGVWEAAHELAQDLETVQGDWIHAYLHRKEGDFANAKYWYRRAGKPVAQHTLAEEWTQIKSELLSASPNPDPR